MSVTAPAIEPHRGHFRVTRLDERYAAPVDEGVVRVGRWLPKAEPLPEGWTDTFTRSEATLICPLLADLATRAAGKGGRPASKPKTLDEQLVARAVEATGLTRAALAERMGVTKGVLSRPLPEARREELRAMIRLSKESA